MYEIALVDINITKASKIEKKVKIFKQKNMWDGLLDLWKPRKALESSVVCPFNKKEQLPLPRCGISQGGMDSESLLFLFKTFKHPYLFCGWQNLFPIKHSPLCRINGVNTVYIPPMVRSCTKYCPILYTHIIIQNSQNAFLLWWSMQSISLPDHRTLADRLATAIDALTSQQCNFSYLN